MNFGQSSVLTNNFVHHFTVLGAGQSAADMVYAAAKAGKKVTWIIRDAGSGPAVFIDVKRHAAYKNAAEIGHTRLMIVLGPSCFDPPSLRSRFIHRTRLGRRIGKKILDNADRNLFQVANYNGRPGAMEGYKQLKPHAK